MTRIAIGFICGVLVALAVGAVFFRLTRPAAGEGVREQTVPDARGQIAEATSAPRLESDKADSSEPEEPASRPDETLPDAVVIDEFDILQSLFASEGLRAQADEARERIESAFAEFDASDGGAEAESRLLSTLMSENPTLLLSAVRDMMRTGDVKMQMTALTAISAVYGDPQSPASVEMGDGVEIAGEANDEPSPKAGTEDEALDAEIRAKSRALEADGADGEEAALRIKLLVDSVATGLEGADADVRTAALETALTLPEEASGVLASQILSGDDAALKQSLLAKVGGSADPGHLRIDLQAMSGEDDSARRQAADNLEQALGRRFSSAEEAAAWIDGNLANPSDD